MLGDPRSYLALDEVIASCRRSRCAEILLILDAGDVGQALMERQDLAPWIDPSKDPADIATFQILASAAPLSRTRGRSVLTQLLLQALDGSAGVHANDGGVRFTPLSEHLEKGLVEGLQNRQETPAQVSLYSTTPQQSPEGSVRGEFRFQPRWPRLEPEKVRDTHSPDIHVRCACLARLPAVCQDRPAELSLVERLRWNLPLAVRLAQQGFPEGHLEEALTTLRTASVEREVRRQAARTLGDLGVLRCNLPAADRKALDADPVETLLHLAVRDRDATVRHEARKSLQRALDGIGQLATGQRLAALRSVAPWTVRRRLRQAAAVFEPYRENLDPIRRGWAFMTHAGLDLAASGRRIASRLRLRRLAQIAALALTLLYVFLAAHYYVSVDRFNNVVVRWGLAGLGALPGVGLAAVTTEAHVVDLVDSADATEERLSGLWLPLDGGALPWGRQLAARLRPASAALAFYRLGDTEEALTQLAQGITAGDEASVRTGVYLSLFLRGSFHARRRLLARRAQRQR